MRDTLEGRFIFWQQYDESEEGQKYMFNYGITTLPHVAILDPDSGKSPHTRSHTPPHTPLTHTLTHTLAHTLAHIRRGPGGDLSAQTDGRQFFGARYTTACSFRAPGLSPASPCLLPSIFGLGQGEPQQA